MFIPDFATVRFDVRKDNWFAGLKLAEGRADGISECDSAGRKALPGGQCGRVLGVIAKVDCVYTCCVVGPDRRLADSCKLGGIVGAVDGSEPARVLRVCDYRNGCFRDEMGLESHEAACCELKFHAGF